MSIEVKCTNCGAEYDLRHEGCPACTITLRLRRDFPPYETWEAKGHIPFEVHGENFAVTRINYTLRATVRWRATHVATGAAVPGTECYFMDEVPARARKVLGLIGREKLQESLAKAAALLARDGKEIAA